MERHNFIRKLVRFLAVGLCPAIWATQLLAQTTNTPALGPGQALVLIVEGSVEFSPVEAQPQRWIIVATNQVLRPGDEVRVGLNSRLVLRFSNQSIIPFAARSHFMLETPPDAQTQSSILLFL